MNTVNIRGLDRAAVLAALYNRSRPMGMGVFQARPGDMTLEQAREAMQIGDDHARAFETAKSRGLWYFDYLYGRPLKINLTEDDLRVDLYDRDNGGPGSAARIIENLRLCGRHNINEVSEHGDQQEIPQVDARPEGEVHGDGEGEERTAREEVLPEGQVERARDPHGPCGP